MDVSVVLEKVDGNGYRATALMPTAVVAEAPTRDQAVDRIRALLSDKLAHSEVIQVEVPASCGNPWLSIAGTWHNHPDIDDVVDHIEAYRREVDADPERQ